MMLISHSYAWSQTLAVLVLAFEYPRRPCATVGVFVVELPGIYIELCDAILCLVAGVDCHIGHALNVPQLVHVMGNP